MSLDWVLLKGRCGILGVHVLNPHMVVNFLEQLDFSERLADKIVSPDRHQLLAIFIHRTGRHRDDLGLLPPGHSPYPADRLMSVHHRHAKIHQDQMGPPFLKLLNRFGTIGRQPDLKTHRSQKLRQQLPVILNVIGDQNPAHRLSRLEPQYMMWGVLRLNGLGVPSFQRQANDKNATFVQLGYLP